MWGSCFLVATRRLLLRLLLLLLLPCRLLSSIIHHLIIISSNLISSHLISSHLISSHLISSHHHLTSSSHHLIPSSSHHLIISSSHHLIISSSHHLIISSSHHLIISPSRHLVISLCHHHLISSSHHLILISPKTYSPSIFCSIFCFCLWQAQHSEFLERVAARLVAAGPRLLSVWCGRRSFRSLYKRLRRAWSPWAAAPVRVASTVLRASRKGYGAPGRRGPRHGPRLLSVWQAAVGRGSYLCGRRGIWSFQKGCSAPSRRGPRLLSVWQNASGRRGPRLLSVWQAQYLELPEKVAARLVAVGRGSCLCGRTRLVAVGRGSCLCGRRSTWRFQKKIAVRLVAVGRGSCLCGRRSTWSLQKGFSARLVAVGRGCCLRGWRSTRSLQIGLRRAWSPWAAGLVCVAGAVLGGSRKGCGAPGRRGPRFLSMWQAQYSEPREMVAARLVAVGRGCCLCGRHSTSSLQKGLRRAWSPWAAAPVCMAGAVLGAFRKGCGAPGRRGPRLLSLWQAQYLEPPERVAARLVAVGRGSCLCGRLSI